MCNTPQCHLCRRYAVLLPLFFVGEGLTGALYWRDLFTLADEIGFCAPRLFQARRYRVNGQDSVYDYNLGKVSVPKRNGFKDDKQLRE